MQKNENLDSKKEKYIKASRIKQKKYESFIGIVK